MYRWVTAISCCMNIVVVVVVVVDDALVKSIGIVYNVANRYFF